MKNITFSYVHTLLIPCGSDLHFSYRVTAFIFSSMFLKTHSSIYCAESFWYFGVTLKIVKFKHFRSLLRYDY